MELQRCRVAHGDHHDGRCAWCSHPLPGRRRRWCSDLCQASWRANHVWTVAHDAALARDGHRCVICGDPEDLEVHHLVPVGRAGYGHGCQHHLVNLQTLCHDHHVEADAARRHAEKGEAFQLTLVPAA